MAAPISQTPVKSSAGGRLSWHYKSQNRDFRDRETALPPIADSGDTVSETAPEIAPEMPPTPSSAKCGEEAQPSETGQSAGITVSVTGSKLLRS
ncbi:hypothetical protein QUA81_07220 [Microcoleus sp. F6_B4]